MTLHDSLSLQRRYSVVSRLLPESVILPVRDLVHEITISSQNFLRQLGACCCLNEKLC